MKPISMEFLLLLLLHSTIIPFPSTFCSKIDAELKREVDSAPAGSTWNILVVFEEDPNYKPPPINDIEESYVQAYQNVLTLTKYADESQHDVIEVVKQMHAKKPRQAGEEGLMFDTNWLVNTLYIRNAWKELINHLADETKPENKNIMDIVEDGILEVSSEGTAARQSISTREGKEGLKEAWGLKKINAPAWWDAKYNGSGVIVGHIDTGVDIYHPSLKWNWVGKGAGWYDPAEPNNTFPYEIKPNASHGTHTIGILVGRGRGSSNQKESAVDFRGVGVAPGARWISCQACWDFRGKAVICPVWLMLYCGRFLYCPNPEDRCSYKPNIVSVSMSCPQNRTYECKHKSQYPTQRLLEKFHEVGIIPVWAAGNNGKQGCETIGDPADSEDAIAVGNININDTLNETSSKGPIIWRYNASYAQSRGLFKPDIVGPGTHVYSTVYTGPAGLFNYDYKTGTSMATPHVAGAIALILSRSANLTYEAVSKILFNNAVPSTELKTTNPSEECGSYKDKDLYNHKLGRGRLWLPDPNDAFRLPPVKIPTRKMPPPPDFTGLPGANSSSTRSLMMGVVMTACMVYLMNLVLAI